MKGRLIYPSKIGFVHAMCRWRWSPAYFRYVYPITEEGIQDSDMPWSPILRWPRNWA